jgi:arsenate reductase
MIQVYIYSKCSTCRNAMRFLQAHGINADIKEITVTPPSPEELMRMLDYQHGNIRKLFNTSGNLYRELDLASKLDTYPLQEALELLSTHGMLVKRPFLLGPDVGLLGFKETQWAETFRDMTLR